MNGNIRVANIVYPPAAPFSLLRDLEFVEYQENLPAENGRNLNEREVDIALVPVSDFALHGGYVGLDYGIAYRRRSHSIILYANQPVTQLNTIYLYGCSSASALLLALLLREKWLLSPRIVPTRRRILPQQLADREGVLFRHEGPVVTPADAFAVALDLVEVWHELTGMPFIPAVWAMRPGTLSMDQHQEFNSVFYRCEKARTVIAGDNASLSDLPAHLITEYIADTHHYYVDTSVMEGMNEFFKLCRSHNLLPERIYKSSTFTLLDRKTTRALKEPGISQLLEESIQGKRIGIREGLRLAEEASLADLGMAADLKRSKLHSDRSIVYTFVLEEEALKRKEQTESEIQAAIADGVNHILFVPIAANLAEIGSYELIVNDIKERYRVSLEGFSVSDLMALGAKQQIHPKYIISRLVTAGLDSVPPSGGGMLIDRIMRGEGKIAFSAMDWLHTIKWAHRYGATSSCWMMLNPSDTWEERLLHLHKLRALQDYNPGFRYFFTVSARYPAMTSIEDKVRATAISRLFLDNVASFQEVMLSSRRTPEAVTLGFGSNEVLIRVNGKWAADVEGTREMLKTLWYRGLDFVPSSFEGELPKRIH